MSTNLKRQLPKLEVVSQIRNSKLRQHVLFELAKDKAVCSAIREIMKNVKSGNIKLTDRQKNQVKKHRKVILEILKRRQRLGKKRQLVVQTGSGFLLPLLIPLVAEAVGALISKAQQ